MADNKNEIQFQPQVAPPSGPSFTDSLPALLSALGGVGLNVAGLVKRTGNAPGNGLLGLAGELQNQAQAAKQREFQTARYNQGLEQDKRASTALGARLGEIQNPNARAEVQTLLENADYDKAASRFETSLVRQKDSKKESDAEKRDLNAALSAHVQELTRGIGDVDKELGQSPVKAAEQISKFFASRANGFEGPEQLREEINQQPWLKRKVSDKEATELYNQYTDRVNEHRPKFMGLIPHGEPSKPRADIFKDFADKIIPKDQVDEYRTKSGISEEAKKRIVQARALQVRLQNPKTRAAAKEEVQMFLSGESLPSTPAPGNPRQPQGSQQKPEGDRMFSPSTGKYFIKKSDGSIVPE